LKGFEYRQVHFQLAVCEGIEAFGHLVTLVHDYSGFVVLRNVRARKEAYASDVEKFRVGRRAEKLVDRYQSDAAYSLVQTLPSSSPKKQKLLFELSMEASSRRDFTRAVEMATEMSNETLGPNLRTKEETLLILFKNLVKSGRDIDALEVSTLMEDKKVREKHIQHLVTSFLNKGQREEAFLIALEEPRSSLRDQHLLKIAVRYIWREFDRYYISNEMADFDQAVRVLGRVREIPSDHRGFMEDFISIARDKGRLSDIVPSMHKMDCPPDFLISIGHFLFEQERFELAYQVTERINIFDIGCHQFCDTATLAKIRCRAAEKRLQRGDVSGANQAVRTLSYLGEIPASSLPRLEQAYISAGKEEELIELILGKVKELEVTDGCLLALVNFELNKTNPSLDRAASLLVKVKNLSPATDALNRLLIEKFLESRNDKKAVTCAFRFADHEKRINALGVIIEQALTQKDDKLLSEIGLVCSLFWAHYRIARWNPGDIGSAIMAWTQCLTVFSARIGVDFTLEKFKGIDWMKQWRSSFFPVDGEIFKSLLTIFKGHRLTIAEHLLLTLRRGQTDDVKRRLYSYVVPLYLDRNDDFSTLFNFFGNPHFSKFCESVIEEQLGLLSKMDLDQMTPSQFAHHLDKHLLTPEKLDELAESLRNV